MSSLSSTTCPLPSPASSSDGAVGTAVCSPTSIPETDIVSTTKPPAVSTAISTVGPVDVPSTTDTSATSSPVSTGSTLDNEDPTTSDTVSIPSPSTSAVSTTTRTPSSESSPAPTTISSPTPRPPLGEADPPNTTKGTSTISVTPHPPESTTEAESPETQTTSISLTSSSSTVSSSSPVQAPTTATQETSTSPDTVPGPGSTTASTGPTRPPVNNPPAAPSETSVDDPSTTISPPTPSSSTVSSPGMSAPPPPTGTTTTRRPPSQGNGETPGGSSSATTDASEAPPTVTTTPPGSAPPGPGTTTSTSDPPAGSTTTTTTRNPPTGTREPPNAGTTPQASTTITSVTTIRSQTGTPQTTSTTLTLTPISTFSSPVQVVITNTEDGSVSTTIPPFLTVTETRTEADGSLTTETHIVANPPGALERGSADENRGLLSRTGAAAGIFATVGVLITAAIFIAYLLWRRRRQSNIRKQWIQGMQQQRPPSFGGYPFDSPSIAGGGVAASAGAAGGAGHNRNGSSGSQLRKPPPAPPPGLFGGSDDELPWAESRRIPEQRAEMKMRPVQPVTQPAPVVDANYESHQAISRDARTSLAGVGTVKYHYGRQSGDHTGSASLTHSRSQSRDVVNSIVPGPPPPPSSYGYNNNSAPGQSPTSSTGSTRNPFAGGVLGLRRSGSGSASDSSSNGTWLNRAGKGKSGSVSRSASMGAKEPRRSISKERISLPMPVNYNAANVPQPVPSPVRKPAVYDPEELFTNRLPPPPPPPPLVPTKTTGFSNWQSRQNMANDYGPSPAPSTPSVYPPTLPADDELDESSDADIDSDGTFDRVMNKPIVAEATTTNRAQPPNQYSGVDGFSAFQNLFTLGSGSTQRSKGPPPPPPPRAANRSVPSLIIDTATQGRARSNSMSSASRPTSATQTAGPAPPRPPRSILRTSNGSLSLGPGPAKVRLQSAADIFPLTPPASTPSHSPHSSYTLPGSPTSLLGPFSGTKHGPNGQVNGTANEGKVQEILSGRRLLLDRRLSERGGSGSD